MLEFRSFWNLGLKELTSFLQFRAEGLGALGVKGFGVYKGSGTLSASLGLEYQFHSVLGFGSPKRGP